MTRTILITGGTGTLGQIVVPKLREAGYHLRVLTRGNRAATDDVEYVTGDLVTGEGIPAAAAGAQIVLHLAGGPKGDAEATANLVQAAAPAGVQHLVYISVIGAERMPLGWFQAKLAAEQAIRDSGIPWTILRAAQFDGLILMMAEKIAKLPVIPVPGGLRFQPVDAREVATRLVELTLCDPAGPVPDLAGPTVYPMGDLLRGYLQARGKRRLMMPVRMPGKAGRAYRAGENLTLSGAINGARTWEDFLTERLAI